MATASSLTLLQFKTSLLLFIVCLVGASNGQSKLCHRSTSKPGKRFVLGIFVISTEPPSGQPRRPHKSVDGIT